MLVVDLLYNRAEAKSAAEDGCGFFDNIHYGSGKEQRVLIIWKESECKPMHDRNSYLVAAAEGGYRHFFVYPANGKCGNTDTTSTS